MTDLPTLLRAHVRHGDITLSSGKKSNIFIDIVEAMTVPHIVFEIISGVYRILYQSVPPIHSNMLAGLEFGGAVIAASIGGRLNISVSYVRYAKQSNSLRSWTITGDVAGRHTIIIDDVATTGGNLLGAADALMGAGANIRDAIVVVDREEGARELLAAHGITLHSIVHFADLAIPQGPKE